MKTGYQLFSAWKRCLKAEEQKAVIRRIGEMGYDGVEFFTYSDIPAPDMKALLDECGLAPINSHVQLDRWRADADGEIAYARALGMDMLTIPYVAPEDRTAAFFSALCEDIPLWGKKCRDNGVTLCYHNHEFEFMKDGDTLLLDRLLEADAQMKLELDTFWCFFAGFDPVETMQRYADRLVLLHLKDYTDLKAQPSPAFTALGTGHMVNVPIAAKAAQMGLPWLIVEQDNSVIDEMESAALSKKTLDGWC